MTRLVLFGLRVSVISSTLDEFKVKGLEIDLQFKTGATFGKDQALVKWLTRARFLSIAKCICSTMFHIKVSATVSEHFNTIGQ